MRIQFQFGLLFAFLMASSAHAINPKLFPGYDTESLSVKVVIPIPEKPEEVTLRPLLIKPSSPPPWKSIVLPSSCAGLEDGMWPFMISEFIKNNIAVVLLDSFNPRGFSSICKDLTRTTLGTRMQDVYQVLDYLRQDARFVKDKIAMGGHSHGASVALLSAYTEALAHLNRSSDVSYNAFIGAAPACEMTFKNTKLLAPLLLIVGTKDDYTTPGPCIREVDRLKNDKEPAAIALIENAIHSFTTLGMGTVYDPRMMRPPYEMPRTYLKRMSYIPKETVIELDTGEEISLGNAMRKFGGFLGNKLFGATVGGTRDKAPEVARLSVEFLKNQGW